MSAPIRSIIVDDEKLAREDLKVLLQEFKEIEVVGEAENVQEAAALITSIHPGLVFLDIQMPGKSGFELLHEIQTDASIIFVTAFDNYAIRAFEVNAQDYLLKPVDRDRLALAIEHLKSDETETINNEKKLIYDDNVFLLVNNTHQFIKVNSIVKILSAGNYSEIYTTGKIKGFVLKSMREWENRLPENNFVRIHRNAIVNLDFVDHIEEWFNYSYKVHLKGIEKPLVMSRRYASKIKGRMS